MTFNQMDSNKENLSPRRITRQSPNHRSAGNSLSLKEDDNNEQTTPRRIPRASKDLAIFYLQNLDSPKPFNKFLDLDNPPRARLKAHRYKTSNPSGSISPLAKKNLDPLASPIRRIRKLSLKSTPKKQVTSFNYEEHEDETDRKSEDSDYEPSASESNSDSDFETLCLSTKKSATKWRSAKRTMESPVDQEFACLPKRMNVRRTGSGLEEARVRLHVCSVPKSLPCREIELEDIYSFIEGNLLDGTGGCIYISGLPGTGKTATVNAAVEALKSEPNLPQFDLVEVNGMRMTEPSQVFVHILKQLTGKKATPKHAVELLEKEFLIKKKVRKPCVLIVDELDLLCTRKQEVLYTLFDWPQHASSRLTVVTIANTMDLPERMLHHRVASRLGLTRLTFQPYSHQQLNTIVSTRLQGLNVFDKKAVELAARKVAAVSGDARRALDICRRAAELREQRAKKTEKKCQIEMNDIDLAIKEMFSSVKLTAIQSLSDYEKLLLRSIVAEFQRTGVEETRLDRVIRQMTDLCRFESMPFCNTSEIFSMCSALGAYKLLLCGPARDDVRMSIRLNCSQHDVTFALKNQSK